MYIYLVGEYGIDVGKRLCEGLEDKVVVVKAVRKKVKCCGDVIAGGKSRI